MTDNEAINAPNGSCHADTEISGFFEDSSQEKKAQFAILATALVMSVCGISYELLAATVSSYFLGNAVLQYSLTIGIFLFAMGIGSHISGKIEKRLLESFIKIQISIGLLGGFSTFILFAAYKFTESFSIIMYLLLLVLGTLVGLIVPLLIRILKNYRALKFSIANVLSIDYVGALVASILFPLLVLPRLGMMQASFFYAILNMILVFFNISIFEKALPGKKMLTFISIVISMILFLGLGLSTRFVSFFESRLYEDEVVFSEQSSYQRIIMTRYKDDFRLFLDGNLQFSSWDEYRFHECEVIPAMALASRRENVLILGGGDGLAAREVLKYKDVKRVTLVDIDPVIVDICRRDPAIKKLNGGAFEDPRMKVVIEDAFTFIENSRERFDVIIVDLPDPNNESLSKLYTKNFYYMLKNHLSKGGMICVQSTSPFFARQTFWCIVHTIESVGLYVRPFHCFVPSMGDWGFTLASNVKIDPEKIKIEVPTRFLDEETAGSLFVFGKDNSEVETEINTLNTHILINYYNSEWKNWE